MDLGRHDLGGTRSGSGVRQCLSAISEDRANAHPVAETRGEDRLEPVLIGHAEGPQAETLVTRALVEPTSKSGQENREERGQGRERLLNSSSFLRESLSEI